MKVKMYLTLINPDKNHGFKPEKIANLPSK